MIGVTDQKLCAGCGVVLQPVEAELGECRCGCRVLLSLEAVERGVERIVELLAAQATPVPDPQN